MGAILANKTILIMGVRNKWSIAWGIAKAAAKEGANLIFTCQTERDIKSTEKIVSTLGDFEVLKCDISYDEEIDNLFDNIKEKYGIVHGVVHAIAHAKGEDLQNNFVNTSREGFAHALNVSAYSLIAVSCRAKDIMPEGGSILTLTYMGSERVYKGYNVMGVAKAALEASVLYLAADLGSLGIRVNAISAGPINTMAAKGIQDFKSILHELKEKAPLKKELTPEDIGNAALYFLSDFSSAVTGEISYVDCGFNIIGI